MASISSSASNSLFTFAELSTAARAAVEQSASEKSSTTCVLRNAILRGIVCRRRRVSRHLAFIDIIEPAALTLLDASSAQSVPLIWLEVKLHSSTLNDPCTDVRKMLVNGSCCALGSLIELSGDAYAETTTSNVIFVAQTVWRLGGADAHPALDEQKLNRVIHTREERKMLGWRPAARTETECRLRDICRLWMQLSSDLLLQQREVDAKPLLLPAVRRCGLCANELLSMFRNAQDVKECAYAIGATRVVALGQETLLLTTGDISLPRCRLRHWWCSERERTQAVANASAKAVARSAARDPDDPHVNKAAKGKRAELFSEWLETTYGYDFLSRGDGVLDVAGGRGAVSFELFNKRRIPCVLIEPRTRRLSREQHIWLADVSEDRRVLCEHRREEFTEKYVCDSFSIIVGVHADQATEIIVDAALAARVPFAVVPCCVFPRANTHRRTPDGALVNTTRHFVEYLRAKHSSIRVAFLPFRGRNAVVYSDPCVNEFKD